MKEENGFFVALDFPDKKSALDLVKLLPSEHRYFKVGMELFYKEGGGILRELERLGKRVFLDLKLYDIPNTVGSAIESLSRYPFFMINIHLLGGEEMAKRALAALEKTKPQGKLIGVTILTSFDMDSFSRLFPLEKMNTQRSPGGDLETSPLFEKSLSGREVFNPMNMARHLAGLAKGWGIHGVVCSPLEASDIKENCGGDFITVTPGIRFSEDAGDDQKRILSPEKARKEGCDFPVVGRPITQYREAKKIMKSYERFERAFSQ